MSPCLTAGVLAGLALFWLAGSVFAQDAPLEASEAASSRKTAPDLVLLKNGGMVRGTISELVPQEYVLIVSVTGDPKRFPMSEVSYAGPTANAPDRASVTEEPVKPRKKQDDEPKAGKAPAKPIVTVHAAEVRLQLRSTPRGLTFHRRSASAGFTKGGTQHVAGFDEMCTAPCEVSMPSGTHTFALSRPNDGPLVAPEVVIPKGAHELTGEYRSRTATRVAVLATGAAVALFGVVLATQDTGDDGDPRLALGIGLATLGVSGGFLVAFAIPDRADVRVSQPSRLLLPAQRSAPGVTARGSF